MADSFRLDPQALSRIVADARSTGSSMEGAVSRLEAVLVDHDGCWGDDDIGKAFAKNYVDNSTKIRGYNQDAADGFGNYAENAESLGREFQELDSENADSVYRQWVDHEYAQELNKPPPEQ